jgi:flagellar hook protein FlgE
MSVLRSLQIGVSGLRANSDALSVTGDNIANVNTVGFKRSRGVFQDILGRAAGNSILGREAGAGVRLAGVEHMWSQGALVNTENATDLAISGEGFFVVEGQVQGTSGRSYTRAGQFHINESGELINPAGLRLQGHMAQPNGTMGSAVENIVVSTNAIPATPTSAVTMAANLDANAPIVAPNFDPLDPTGTSNFSTDVTTFDSLGNAHAVTVFFHKSASNAWDWHAMVDGGELTGGTAGLPTENASGTLTFTTDGELDTETPGASSWDFVNATAAQAIAFDFGTSITTDLGSGLDGTTQFAATSSTTGLTQDGFAAGSVDGISIAQDGTVVGTFTNGQQRNLGQVVIATFANINGLERGSAGLWTESRDSGAALIGVAETGGRGSIVAGSLEQSNVDLGNEFVNLISYQRGFQANSRIITTADEMYGELVNIKR